MLVATRMIRGPKSHSNIGYNPVDLLITKNYYHAPYAGNQRWLLAVECVNGPVAQLVEPAAHNRLVPGSSPGGPTRTTLTAWNRKMEVLL